MCAAATQLIAINADGTVAPCAMFPRSAGRYTEGLTHLWRESALFNQVRGQRFDAMNACSSCEVQAGCDPCMAYGIVEHDDKAACNSASKLNASSLHQLKLRRARSLPIVQPSGAEGPAAGLPVAKAG